MPQMSGEEIVRRLMERKSTYPILVVSGFLTEKVVLGWFPGASNITFLRKPFALDQLWAELNKYFEPMPAGAYLTSGL
jgi:DNA-binding response OmpR family regulator